MSISGRLATMAIADVIQWARTAQRTGVLTVNDEADKQLQLTFIDGNIISSSTSDQRATYRAYLIFLGLCTENDITEAMEIQRSTGAMLASVLVHERKITIRDAMETLVSKTLEDFCDV